MNRNVVIIVAIVLIALGAFGLARGKFNYTDKHATQVGNIELSVKEKDSVAVPQ